MKARKALAILLTAVMTAGLVTGCAGSSGEQSTAPASSAQTTTEEGASAGTSSDTSDPVQNLINATDSEVDLTLWCSESEAYQNIMKELVDSFQEKYSDVTFNITIGAESEANCKDDVLSDIEAAADLFVFPDDQLLGLQQAGALQSIDATYTYDPKTEDSAETIDAATVDGTLYAYPLMASNGYFLFYNKNLLSKEDVSSMDNLLAAAAKQNKTVGMEVSGAWYLYSFFAGAGLTMKLSDDGKTNVCNWNATDTKYTGAKVAEAVTKICRNSAMVDCNNEDAQAFALNGEMIADVNGTWAAEAFQKAYGDGYAACKLPTFTVNGDQVQMGSFAGYKFLGVNAYSKNVGWAMLLAEYLTSEESQEKIGAATGEAPANTTAAQSEAITSSPALAALAEQSQYADLQRVGDAYWDPAATLGQSLSEGNYDDVQKLLDDAVAGITQ